MPSMLCKEPTTTELYTLSLHDALPILRHRRRREVLADQLRVSRRGVSRRRGRGAAQRVRHARFADERSEEHTSELQSHSDLVCRLLLEKKKPRIVTSVHPISGHATGAA